MDAFKARRQTMRSTWSVSVDRPFVAIIFVTILCHFASSANAYEPSRPAKSGARRRPTYCNPMNLDYGYCPIPNFIRSGKHRATADPVIVRHRGDFYLFSTNQKGYWYGSDLINWTFVSRSFLKPEHDVFDDLCAPAVWVMDDALFVIGSTHGKSFPIYKSVDPKKNVWTEAISAFQEGAWDPAFFLDDDGRLFCYYGSSNLHPIYGREVDRKTLQPIGERVELFNLRPDRFGWERFGEGNDNTFLKPFVEGAWMNKRKGKYYLQYGAPGTEFSGYADGVYVGDGPMGPFKPQAFNPFCYQPGGFARGAGHGATFDDATGNYYHVSTISIADKNNFERRLGLWPTYFDDDGTMRCDNAYGDFPHYLDVGASKPIEFTGWMILNYHKPTKASSYPPGHPPNFAVDEDIKTYWAATTGSANEWFETDLGAESTVRAIQVNYADHGATIMGKRPGLSHRYRIKTSIDGLNWRLAVDKSTNDRDVPHDYVELDRPIEARHVRIENVAMPSGAFALSGFRVFGQGRGKRPETPVGFLALRGPSEPRNAWLKWRRSSDAVGYVIRAGLDPKAMNLSVTVFGAASDYYFRAMDGSKPYYFQIEAFNESGVSDRTPPVETRPK